MRAAGPAGEPTTVEARLFGLIEVAAGGRRLGPRDLGGHKANQVLELLLVAHGHSVTKDRLADQLWGEAMPKRAFAALENHVSALRRHLYGVGRGRDLVLTDPGYRVAAERGDLDLDRFDERITAAGKAGTRMARPAAFDVAVAELPTATRALLLVAALDEGDRLDEILAAGGIVSRTGPAVEDLEPGIAARLVDVDDAFLLRSRHPLIRSVIQQDARWSRNSAGRTSATTTCRCLRVLTDERG